MTTQPILHNQTELLLKNYIDSPSHAVILTGPQGVGKKHLALWLAKILNLNVIEISKPEDKQKIGIEQIHQLYIQTRTADTVCVIVDNAHEMTNEAQNAFLKLLEEPTKNTYFILTTVNTHMLLATIQSRSQVININPPEFNKLANLVNKNDTRLTKKIIDSLLISTKGYPGTLVKISNDSELLDEHMNLIKTAKKFYGANTQDRLQIISDNTNKLLWNIKLIDSLSLIVETLIKSNISNPAATVKLTQQAAIIEETAMSLSKSGNPKIHMTKLALIL